MASSSRSAGEITLETLKTIVNILEDISDDIPAPASAIIKLVQRVITTVDDVRSNREECDLLKRRLLELLAVVTMAMQKQRTTTSGKATIPLDLKQNVDGLLENLKAIDQEVSEIKDKFNSKRKRHKLTSMFWVKSYTERLRKCRDDLDWAMKTFDVSSHLGDAVRLWEMSRKVEAILTNQYLENLPRAKYASFDCERPDKPSTCFEGTRTAVLKLITDWITNPDPTAERFFWLNGIAGIGKTTVACTIAGLMQNLGLLGGQFCFSRRGEAELRNPALVFPTIAYQLARFDPEFGRRITAALEADPEAPYASLKQQLDRLITNPLKGLDRDPERVVVLMFDAFDECESRGAKEILQLLVAALPSLPFFLKIFVTSRPEHHIRSVLTPANNLRMTALHDIETSVVKIDILLYLRNRLRKLGEERGLPLDWIKDAEIELLAEKARNLFIHAATSLRFLSKGLDPRMQLVTLLKIITTNTLAGSAAKPFNDLDQLYQQILLNLIPEENPEEVAAQLRLVLGSIVLLRDPLPVAALETLIGSSTGSASITLDHLHSVILIPPPPDDCPRVYHPSFTDFLQDHNRCTDYRLWIATEEHETRMALSCLKLLNTKLHKGMLGSVDPSLLNSEVADIAGKIEAAFPPELQYACRYWASHLGDTSASNAELSAALDVFASCTMLPWMEAMSWLGETQLAIKCLRAVNSWTTSPLINSLTKALLYDGHRLLLAHRSTIALSAQHLARSVLPFAPLNVVLTSCYRVYSDITIRVIRGVESKWPALLMVLTGHSTDVNSVAISSDGCHAASGSDDYTIRLWDPVTGACTTTLEGHSGYVRSVEFSSNGTCLASGSYDQSVRIWDVITGICLITLDGHSDYIYSVAFSLNGSTLASGSEDRTIRLWDTTSWTCVATFTGHSEAVLSVAFSPNGSRLASGSQDKTIRIWDTTTGTCTETLEGHLGSVFSVRFSPDGSRLASGSQDKTVRTWDMATYSVTRTYEGHSREVNSVAFSSDGTRLASGSTDEAVRIWDTATGECIATFRGHSNSVLSIAICSDGSRLISGSADGTVRRWDAAVEDGIIHLEGHSNYVVSLAFSPDGSRLASSSWDCTARIWDTTNGRCVATLEGHSDWVNTVAFNPDGSRLATGSLEGIVRLWDSITGNCIITSEPLDGGITSLSFSSDGAHLRFNGAFTLNVSTGEQVEDVDGRQFNNPAENRFEIHEGRLFRTGNNGSKDLICFLPSWAPAHEDLCASFKLSGGGDLVAIGCKNGTVFILEVSSA